MNLISKVTPEEKFDVQIQIWYDLIYILNEYVAATFLGI